MLRRLLWGRPRRQAGLSLVLLIFGVLGCFGSTMAILLGAPASWLRAREVASLPQPQPEELASLSPGTEMLLLAQLPPDVATSAPHGLALFYVEERNSDPPTRQAVEVSTPDSSIDTWERVTPPPATVELRLSNDEPIDVQLSPNILLLNGQQIEDESQQQADGNQRERRYVGYLPGRALTLQGTWEGKNRFTANVSYAGAPAEYTDYLSDQSGLMMLYGMFCCTISLGLLVVGGVLRLIRG